MTESTLAPESKPLDRSPGNDGPASEGAHDTSDKVTENGDSQSVEEEVLDDEDMDAEDSGSQKADEKSITEGDGKKRLIRETPCGNDCTNGCNSKFPEEMRVKIYDIYWGFQGGSEEQQKWMEKYCIEKAIPKISAKSMGATRNRSFVYLYFLPQLDQNMQKIRVCKKFLAATLGITERILSGFVYRFVGNGGLDVEDTEWSPMAGYENCSREQMFLLREFIQRLPAEPVHYCRNEQCTRKLYELPSSIPDVSTLYGMYSSSEESLQREPVDEGVFRNVLYQDYNLSFCTATRGDICSVREYRKSGKK